MVFEVSLSAGEGGCFDGDTLIVTFVGEGATVTRCASPAGGDCCVNASSESDELTMCENWLGLGREMDMGGGRREVVVVGIGTGFDEVEFCVDVAMSDCLASSIACTHSCTSVADPAWR